MTDPDILILAKLYLLSQVDDNEDDTYMTTPLSITPGLKEEADTFLLIRHTENLSGLPTFQLRRRHNEGEALG